MTWFFLSVFNEDLQKSSEPESKSSGLSVKESKFNELYINDGKKTEKLYARFMQTKSYKSFINSTSLSTLFN